MTAASIEATQRLYIAQYCAELVMASINAADRRAFKEMAALFTTKAKLYRATNKSEPLIGRTAIQASYDSKPKTRLT